MHERFMYETRLTWMPCSYCCRLHRHHTISYRFLLGKGCDRTKLGKNHSSKGLAPAAFEGLTAEGWARKRGHDEVADLIHLGL